jgi:hypothetical protein
VEYRKASSKIFGEGMSYAELSSKIVELVVQSSLNAPVPPSGILMRRGAPKEETRG